MSRHTQSRKNVASGACYAQNHYSAYDISHLWKVSLRTINSIFLIEPGVLVISRNPVQISIPESVVARVYRRMTATADTEAFDVFLAHNGKDIKAVEGIAQQLQQRGLNPWLDKWHLPKGRVFQQKIERVLSVVPCTAVFIGSHGIGPWEEMELRMAVNEFVERKAPVIPVLLPKCKQADLPLISKAFSQVRFRTLEDAEALDNLVWGITAVRDKRYVRTPATHSVLKQ
jgi:TIR domain